MQSDSSAEAPDRPVLAVIVASTRPGRVGLPVGRWIDQRAREFAGFEVRLVDLAEQNLPFLDEPKHPAQRQYVHDHTKAWSEQVDGADAFIFVMPEYNHGMTAPLKNAIDFVSQEWANKPVAFVSYGGASGGMRAVQMVKQVVAALKMVSVSEAVAIHGVQASIEANGNFVPEDRVNDAASTMLHALQRWAVSLRAMRTA